MWCKTVDLIILLSYTVGLILKLSSVAKVFTFAYNRYNDSESFLNVSWIDLRVFLANCSCDILKHYTFLRDSSIRCATIKSHRTKYIILFYYRYKILTETSDSILSFSRFRVERKQVTVQRVHNFYIS